MNNFLLTQKTPYELNMLLAERIAKIRRRRKISQKALSAKSGVSLGSLKRFEQTGEISLLSLSKLAIALEIDDELESLFENVPFLSIEEVIRSQDGRPSPGRKTGARTENRGHNPLPDCLYQKELLTEGSPSSHC